jgi:hypothetical protein
VLALAIPGVNKLAVSPGWLAWRASRAGGGDVIAALPLADPAAQREVAKASPPAQLSRPTLDGDTLAFGFASARTSRIVAVNLQTGARRTLRRGGQLDMVTNPTLSGGALLYVRTSSRTQQLRLANGGRERTVYRIAATARRDRGYEPGHHPLRKHHHEPHPPPRQPRGTDTTLWTTALSARAAYVTRVTRGGGRTQTTVVRVRR